MRTLRLVAIIVASALVIEFAVASEPAPADASTTAGPTTVDSRMDSAQLAKEQQDAAADAQVARQQASASVWVPPELIAQSVVSPFVEPSKPYSPSATGASATGASGRSTESEPVVATGGTGLDVDGVTGEVTVTARDGELGGLPGSPSFSRLYGSQSTATGMLGDGWTTSLDRGLRVDGTGIVVVFDSSGGRSDFSPTVAGAFDSPKGSQAVLTRIADSGERAFHLANIEGDTVYFSAHGYVTAELDRFGRGSTYRYDAVGRPVIAEDVTSGRYLRFNYHGDSPLLQGIDDYAGRQILYGYNGQSRLAKVTHTSGAITAFGYDSTGKLTNLGTPSPATESGTAHLTISYDTNGRVDTIAQQRTSKISVALDEATTTFRYNVGSTVVTDARGNSRTYDFDDAGRTTKVSDANNVSAVFEWNAGRVTSIADEGGNAGAFGYDSAGRQVTAALPTGATSTTIYSGDGGCGNQGGGPDDVKCLVDSEGHRTAIDYDAGGTVAQVRDEIGTIESAQYSVVDDPGSCAPVAGLLCSTTDGNGVRTVYSRDANGNVSNIGTLPIGGGDPLGVKRYGHDSLGRMTSITTVTPQTDDVDPTTTMAYDIADRLVYVVDPGGRETWLGYYADGSQAFSVGAGTLTTYTYDSQGFLLNKKSTWTEGTPASTETNSEYDALGNLTSVSSREGTTKYSYNSDNRVTTIEQPGGDCTVDSGSANGCTRIDYDTLGREITRIFPGGATQSTGYDASGRVSLIDVRDRDSDPLERVEYTYADSAGKDTNRISSRATYISRPQFTGFGTIPSLSARATTSYSYDARGRLISAVQANSDGADATPVASWLYSFDGADNRISQTISGRTSPTTDAASPPTTRVFSYDALNRIIATSADTGEWSYNAEGEQLHDGVAKSEASHGQEPRPSDSKDQSYIADPDGELVGHTDGSGSHYFVKDINGSVIVVVDDEGKFEGAYRYSPFGEIVSATEKVESNRIRFLGRYEDPAASGIYQLGVRAYDASLGRFLEPDASESGGRSYGYSLQDPVNFLDTSGFRPLSVLIGRAGEIVIAVVVLGTSRLLRVSEPTMDTVRAILAPVNGFWWASVGFAIANTTALDSTNEINYVLDTLAHTLIGMVVYQIHFRFSRSMRDMWARDREIARANAAAERAMELMAGNDSGENSGNNPDSLAGERPPGTDPLVIEVRGPNPEPTRDELERSERALMATIDDLDRQRAESQSQLEEVRSKIAGFANSFVIGGFGGSNGS